MNTKSILLTFMWLLSMVTVAGAQELSNSTTAQKYAQPVEHPTVYSPQVEAMLRHDNSNVNLNTGTVSVTIPLIEFSDPDFDVDVSLSYSMDGFKPLAPDNYVGMGWRLNCGGVVTREVHGIPDEFVSLNTDDGFFGECQVKYVKGFMAGTQLSNDFIENNMGNSTSLYGKFQHNYIEDGKRKIVVRTDGDTEMSPDVFRFSFGKHSGMFTYDLDGTFKVISDNGGKYIVEMHSLNNTPSQTDYSRICIITDDGYRYYFGGSYDSLEYSALSWRDFSSGIGSLSKILSSERKRYMEITAWHLTSVVAPNGRTLNYNYVQLPGKDTHDDPCIMMEQGFYGNPTLKKDYMKCYQIIPFMKGEGANGQLTDCALSYTLNKMALVSSISVDEKRITFSYDNFPSPYFCLTRHGSCNEYGFVSECGAKLTNIILENSVSGFKENTTLAYHTLNERLLLSSIARSRYGRFDIQYYSSGTFDKSLTIDIDKWGFWSGHGANTSLLQIPDPARWGQIDQITGDFIRDPDDNNREPTGREFDAFMLKSITYPTGGNISYEYEPHTYSSYYSKPSPTYSGIIAGVNSFSKLAGGARVKAEVYDDKSSTSKRIKRYVYERGDGRSWGYLRKEGENYLRPFPISRFGNDTIIVSQVCYPTDCYKIVRTSTLGGYISYSNILEYDYESAHSETFDRSLPHKETEYTVDVDLTMSAGPSFVSDTITTYDHVHTLSELGFLHNYYAEQADFSKSVGKVRSESYYAENQRLVKKVEYVYQTSNLTYASYINGFPGVHTSYVGCYSQVAKIPFFHSLLKEVKTTEYDADGRMHTSTVRNEYDVNGYLVSTSEKDSEGRTIKTCYEYPVTRPEIIYAKMRMMNILSPVIYKTVIADSSEVIYTRHNDYRLMNRFDPYAPEDTSLELSPGSMPVLDAVYDTYGNGNLQKQAEYMSYDSYGNPLWIRSHGRDHSFVWGCVGQELLAIVNNATEAEVAAVLGVEDLNTISEQYEPSSEIGSIIRAALADALVTSYTYIPGIGVSSETGPDGQTLHYSYDEKGRLYYIYRIDDGNISIIEKYDYNLINE